MEVLFHAGRHRGACHVCDHLCVGHNGELGDCGDTRHCKRGDVHAHAGRYLLRLYLGERKIFILQKEIYGCRKIGKGECGRTHSAQKHQG